MKECNVSMCLGRSPSFDSLFHSLALHGPLLVQLYIYLVGKTLQNGAKFKQNLTPGFKNCMRNLDDFRQAVESFVQKKKILSAETLQRIYLTLLSTTCVKIHRIPYVIFETISQFSRHNSSVFFSSNIIYFLTKAAHQSANFQTFYCSHLNSSNSSRHFSKHKPVPFQISNSQLLRKGAHQSANFKTFGCSHEN